MAIYGRYVSLCLCVVLCTRVHCSYLLGFACLKAVAAAAAISAIALMLVADTQAAFLVVPTLASFYSTHATST